MRYFEDTEKIMFIEHYDLENITIQEIDRITQIMFMDYVLKCNDKINQVGIPCTLYKHLNSLIRQYTQDDSDKVKSQLKDYIFKLEETNSSLKKEIMCGGNKSKEGQQKESQQKESQHGKGWFY